MFNKQSGQALPLGIALLFAGVLTGVVLFNTGQAINNKTRLANAADAAVYSGITWQARALNFNAYTNRAMVANQVAIAQAVSLQSWAQYGRVTGNNIGTVLKPVPIVGQIATATQRVTRAIEPVINALGKGMILVVDPINGALSLAQEAMFLSAFAASPEIIANVASANDDRLEWTSAFSVAQIGLNLHRWEAFTEQHRPEDALAMDERVAMINASTDRFTKRRSWEFFDKYLPLTPLHWARIDRSGSTRLLRDRDTGKTEWKAIDTLSMNNKLYLWFGRVRRFEIPIGYSLKYASDSDESLESCESFRSCPDWFGRNRYAQYLARNFGYDLSGDSNTAKVDVSYQGVRAYRSLSKAIRQESRPTLLLRTELRLPLSSVRDAEAVNVATTYVDGVQSGREDVLSSVSSAEVYFNRPEDDSRVEYASAYNPFWTTRLAATPASVRTAALALRAGGTGNFARSRTLATFEDAHPEINFGLENPAALAQWTPDARAAAADRAAHQMREVLIDALEGAAQRLLAGVVPDGVSSGEDFVSGALNGIDIADINETVAEISQDIDELRTRYREAREAVREKFLEAIESVSTEINERREQLNQQIDTLRRKLMSAAGDEKDGINARIRELVEIRDGVNGVGGLNDLFRKQLAEELVSIVNDILPDWPIGYAEALDVVTRYLNSEEDVSDLLYIIDIPENEDNPNE